VKKQKAIALDFIIDKLTNSIENSVSGELFDTVITQLNLSESKQLKKTDWIFNWKAEMQDESKN